MKNKLFSIFTALAMVLGILVSPFTSAHAAEATETKTVTLHKLVMSKQNLTDWDSDALEKKGYDGTQNTDQLKALLDNGNTAKEVAGVYFAVKYNSGQNKGKYVTINEAVKENPVYGAVDSLDAQLPEGHKLLAGKTEANGIVFNTIGLEGNFLIEEIHEKSSYVGDDGEAITDSKAVPVAITLPLVNDKGIVEHAHVYPKNTEEKPEIDKNFASDNDLEVFEDENNNIKAGANYDNYDKKKATAEAELGKKVPYEVKTQIPAQSKLQQAKWEDTMTDGLTFNRDLEVKIGETTLTKDTDYTLYQTDKGFVLRLTDEGLKLVNGKTEIVEVVLLYSATVNKDAIVDQPEKNDVTFNYGNNPTNENDPIPGKPNEQGELKVEKTWDDGVWAEGGSATFELRDAETGRKVTADDLVEPKDEAAKAEFEEYKKNFNAEVTIGYPGKDAAGQDVSKTSDSWKYLNPDKQYIAVETKSTSPSDVEYVQGENGTLKATNHKSVNPKPLNPTEPKVVLGGKKFVKTNQEGTERLVGAQFIVLDSKGENYLVAKSSTEENAANVDVTTAKKNLDDAVKAYNELSADEQKGEKGTKAKGNIDTTQQAYNKAVKDAAKAYKWEKLPTTLNEKVAPEGAIVLTSDSEGKFEITGLEYGEYKLKEITPPSGFAKLNGNEDFTVAKGSYAGDAAKEFKYEVTVDTEKGEKQTYGQQVKNKKVTIPQTGGIGSLIFVVAGLAIMAGAYVAYRKNQARA